MELTNFAVEAVSSKCTSLSETEGEGEVKVKIYRKCIEKMVNLISQNEATVGIKFDVH